MSIEKELQKRILILDGAMGTMIQKYMLTEADFRNAMLQQHAIELKGNNDILNITRPDVIKDIHVQYLHAGVDILCTNTFNGNCISQADYETAHLVYNINHEGAAIARRAADECTRKDGRTRYVAGAMGPSTRLASISPVLGDPGYRNVTFDQLAVAFREQALALIDGGVDLFLLETITDTLNAKAALYALMQIFKEKRRQYPIMVSGTITDASGRILSGQTLEAFLISISHAPLLSVGLNCALGANELRPHVQVLAQECQFYVSTHPNAGLPNAFGEYDQTPEEIASIIADFAREGWLNIVGGCCGTTPAHIKAIADSVKPYAPRKQPVWTADYYNAISERRVVNTPSPDIRKMIALVSGAQDLNTLQQIKTAFEQGKKQYHSEQAMLINAHILSKRQHLQYT